MIVHLYCLCWNEAAIIPHFLRHYGTLADRIFVFDNHSTDDTVGLLEADPRVTVEPFTVTGDSFVLEEFRLSESVWQCSRPEADWVVFVDMDEFLYHPDLTRYLGWCTAHGITALRTVGYDMVHHDFPAGPQPIHQVVTRGVRSLGFDKLCIFDPKAIDQTNFTLGRHGANPVGRVTWPTQSEVLLLHYKKLGFNYYYYRNRVLSQGLKAQDIAQGWGAQYRRERQAIEAQFDQQLADAAAVPGLAGGPDTNFAEWGENIVRRSSRFDPAWYLERYPDIAAAGVDPVAHFYHHGWREGRLPAGQITGSWPHGGIAAAELDDLIAYFRDPDPIAPVP